MAKKRKAARKLQPRKATKRKQVNDKVPAATIRGDYSTYEDRTRRNIGEALGHVVDLRLENMALIELGGWGSTLKIRPMIGCRATIDERGTVHIVKIERAESWDA